MRLGIFLLGSVVALAAIIVGSSVYFTWLMQRMVMNQLQEIDIIRSTGLPPQRWTIKRRRKNTVTLKQWQRQNKKNLRKLGRLVSFIKRTPLVEDEETRKDVLRELEIIRREWESMEYDC